METESLYQHDIEQPLKQLLSRQITIDSNRRNNKRGKLVLYRIAGHNLELVITVGKGPQETVIIPYPFDFAHDVVDNRLILSYDIRKLFNAQALATAASLLHGIKCSKHVNNSITIKYV